MKKINIMHLRNSSSFYGAELVILSICKNISSENFNCSVTCFDDPRYKEIMLIDEIKRLGIPTETIKIGFRFDLFAIFKLRKLLNSYKIDILHCHDYKSDFIGFFVSKFKKVKLITTIHGWRKVGGREGFYENIDLAVMKYFDQIIAVSEEIQEELFTRGFSQSKISVINNGIDTDYFNGKIVDAGFKKTFGIEESFNVIGTVGRFNEEKGQRYFIEAASDVVKLFPNTIFLVVGDGYDNKLLKDLTASLSLDKRVIFSGFMPPSAIKKIYSLMNIFILPSLTEGIPLALLEAMAMSIPVIATNVGGIPRIIEHGKTGYLIPRADAKAISEAIKDLLGNKEKAVSMAEAGQEFVRREFSIYKTVRKIEEVYRRLVSK